MFLKEVHKYNSCLGEGLHKSDNAGLSAPTLLISELNEQIESGVFVSWSSDESFMSSLIKIDD